MIDTSGLLKEVESEIARLTRLRDALLESSAGTKTGAKSAQKRRLSQSGSLVIALAAKLRHAKRKGDRALVKDLEKKLEAAKAAKEKAVAKR